MEAGRGQCSALWAGCMRVMREEGAGDLLHGGPLGTVWGRQYNEATMPGAQGSVPSTGTLFVDFLWVNVVRSQATSKIGNVGLCSPHMNYVQS